VQVKKLMSFLVHGGMTMMMCMQNADPFAEIVLYTKTKRIAGWLSLLCNSHQQHQIWHIYFFGFIFKFGFETEFRGLMIRAFNK
jgi:hypothetical protein